MNEKSCVVSIGLPAHSIIKRTVNNIVRIDDKDLRVSNNCYLLPGFVEPPVFYFLLYPQNMDNNRVSPMQL